MCGRYRIKNADRAAFEAAQKLGVIPPPSFSVRYNIAPSQIMPVIANGATGAPRTTTMRWGFVPFWDKAVKPKFAPINARSEEAFSKPMFKQAIQRRRCLIPADGFYEWQKLDPTGKLKQPFDIHLRDERPFFFAGIYEEATELHPETYLLFTTQPNAVVAPIHDRMPAILTDDCARRWLAPGPLDADAYAALTASHPAEDTVAVPISTLVNSPKNDSPEILAPPSAELF